MALHCWPPVAGEEGLDRCSKGRHGTGGAAGGPTRSGRGAGGAARCWRRRWTAWHVWRALHRRSGPRKKPTPARCWRRHRARKAEKTAWGVRGERGGARGRFGYLLEHAGMSGELGWLLWWCCGLAAGRGIAGGVGRLQTESRRGRGGAESGHGAAFSSLPCVGGRSGCIGQ